MSVITSQYALQLDYSETETARLSATVLNSSGTVQSYNSIEWTYYDTNGVQQKITENTLTVLSTMGATILCKATIAVSGLSYSIFGYAPNCYYRSANPLSENILSFKYIAMLGKLTDSSYQVFDYMFPVVSKYARQYTITNLVPAQLNTLKIQEGATSTAGLTGYNSVIATMVGGTNNSFTPPEKYSTPKNIKLDGSLDAIKIYCDIPETACLRVEYAPESSIVTYKEANSIEWPEPVSNEDRQNIFNLMEAGTSTYTMFKADLPTETSLSDSKTQIATLYATNYSIKQGVKYWMRFKAIKGINNDSCCSDWSPVIPVYRLQKRTMILQDDMLISQQGNVISVEFVARDDTEGLKYRVQLASSFNFESSYIRKDEIISNKLFTFTPSSVYPNFYLRIKCLGDNIKYTDSDWNYY